MSVLNILKLVNRLGQSNNFRYPSNCQTYNQVRLLLCSFLPEDEKTAQ